MKSLLLSCMAMLMSGGTGAAFRTAIWQPDTTLRVAGPVAFNAVRITDARPDKSSIGSLATGAFNRNSTVVTDGPLEACLTAYTNLLLRGARTSPRELLVVLRDLKVEDRKASEEIGTLHLHADLFLRTGDRYEYYATADSLYEAKSGWDVTRSLRSLISISICNMLETPTALTPPVVQPETYSIESAVSREDDMKARWPLYTTAKPPRGIYYSLEDFLQLRSSDDNFIKQHTVDGFGAHYTYFYRRGERGRKGIPIGFTECFAIFDGDSWFLARDNRFLQLKKEGADFYVTLLRKGLVDNSAGMGASFGLLGAAVASGDYSKHDVPYRHRFAPATGTFVPVRRPR